MTTNQAIERQAEQANAATALQQALAKQPQIETGLDLLGEGFLGDVAVEFYGKLYDFGRGPAVDMEDIALAGTTVSMRTLVSVKRWTEIETQILDRILRNL
ncbi:hypothetical protein KMC49_gp44 [Ralstonia phage Firinga]|nr:hypothetical protein KMC49_gp44 [Ralstonia phage Firinga]QMV33112.1 hypothetical protein 18C_00044 [Ralstonia phage Firinga]QMV33345.1 hypothetical protein 12C_00035 [Ralstonia phage Hennie]